MEEKMINKYWNICKTILKVIVLFIVIFLFFKVVVFDNDDEKNKFILENTEIYFFNDTNVTYITNWLEGQSLRSIKSFNDSRIMFELKPEICEGEIMYEDSKSCQKVWFPLEKGEQLWVLIQKEEEVLSNIPIFKDGDTLGDELCNKLDKPLVIYKQGCPGCAVAVPLLERLEQDLNMSFEYIDISIKEDREYLLNKLKFNVRFVPSLIAKCVVHTGALSKEEYKEILQEKVE